MARPLSNKVSYFPHTVTHGKKMSYLEKKYQNDGYATWFKILEEIGNTDYHYLDLSKEVQIMFLADRCLVSEELLIYIINDLIKLEEFDKELWYESKILYNEKFVMSIKDAYKNRKNAIVCKNSLLLHIQSLCGKKLGKCGNKLDKTGLLEGDNPQSKVKETKVNETKEIKQPTILFNFRKELLILGANENYVNDWLKVRKTKKATNTETALKSFINQVSKSNKTIDEVLKICIEKDWKGFQNSWIEQKNNLTAVEKLNQKLQTNL
jgi:hypothetical protein